ncbi:hypothetical protein [Sutcliffiella cohnii]|uniref:hypothetical protein n=1 Tax=Sutcliffiella cohnii TaxID=33932 RepID=UPI00082B5AB4|nr:hypothetical protein [Sutcliffiella cohnii]
MSRQQYSRLDLIGEELMKLQDKKITDKIISFLINTSKYVYVKLDIPADLYVRANVLCDDIETLSEEEFDQNRLLSILYDDFLRENRMKEALFQLYQRLTVHDRRAPSIKGLYEIHNQRIENDEYYELTVRIKRKEALRGEVLLSDLSNVYPKHPYTLEMVLETIYIDFLNDIKKGGNYKAVKELLKRMAD